MASNESEEIAESVTSHTETIPEVKEDTIDTADDEESPELE
jgi:hypothetical protein